MILSTSFEDQAVRTAVVAGELNALDASERAKYYEAVCTSVGLNPLTRPLEYIELNGKLTLYAKRDATDQLRRKYQVSVEILDRMLQDDVYIVRARATMPDGRTDESLGAVSIGGLEGENLANALMKAETKAKRRVALSICGLGMLDETEVDSIPGVRRESAPSGHLQPSAIFRAWDGLGRSSRTELYAHVKATFGKRVTALQSDELQAVLQWIEGQQTPMAVSEVPDAAA